MGERNVLNRYYPLDYDPSKFPRVFRPKRRQVEIVRMMLPISIRCNNCGTYIDNGTNFNSRKETGTGEKYLGIQVFRFCFKCSTCLVDLAIKTDPQNSGYVVESGATRINDEVKFLPICRGNSTEVEAEEMSNAMEELII